MYPLQRAENFTIHRRGPTFGWNFLAFNVYPGTNPHTGEPYVAPEKRNWFSNCRFRQAVAHSIDKDAIIGVVENGVGYPQWASVSPAAGDFHNPDVRRYEFDIDRANAILDDLGWIDTDEHGIREDSDGNPINFNLATNTGNTKRQKVGAIIHRGLQDIGIGAVIPILRVRWHGPAVDVYLRLGGHYHRLHRNRFRASLQYRFLAAAAGTCTCGIPTKWSRIRPGKREIDDLYTRGSQELDHDRRVGLYHDAQAIVAENVPVIYTVHR